MKSREFTATIGDKEIEFTVVSPSLKDRKEADKIYNNAFTEALQSKAVVRARLDDLLVDQGLWDENKQQKFDTLQKNILDNEKKLAQGGIPLKAAREIALEMRKDRAQMRELISVKTNLDTHTAEGHADNAKFNYLVYACTLNKETQTKYFNSYEDYMERSSEEVAVLAAQNLANMIYGLEANYEHKLPENEFLINYKFVNKDLRFINKEGKLVDEEGRLVDESGRFINEAGEYVDKYGNPVDSEGDYKVDFAPFLDDEGNPVELEKEEKTEETSKKTTKKSSQSKAKENES